MKKTSNTIVFFGSGPVAAESLRQLYPYFSIEAVVTKPRPSYHKGSVPVLEAAEKLEIPTFTATNKHEVHDIIEKQAFRSEVGVLIDFAIIIQEKTIQLFKKGIVNSHFSLLPEWRGPDPITFAVLSGQKQSGTSIMLLAPGVDEGPLLAQAPYDMPTGITTPLLTRELIDLSTKMLIEIIPLYLSNKIHLAPQDKATIAPSYSRKLTKKDGVIDWKKSATQIEREVRAFLGWPSSRTILFDKEVIVTQAKVISKEGTPGAIEKHKKRLIVHASEGSLEILRLKPAGKKEMPAAAFLAGIKH